MEWSHKGSSTKNYVINNKKTYEWNFQWRNCIYLKDNDVIFAGEYTKQACSISSAEN